MGDTSSSSTSLGRDRTRAQGIMQLNSVENGGSNQNELNLGHITHLYTQVWHKVISPDDIKGLDLNELSKDISSLRQLFACVVCEKLVDSDFLITSNPTATCPSPHLQCKTCDGKDSNKPCTLHSTYSDDSEAEDHHYLQLLVESYKGFCSVVIQSPEYARMIAQEAEEDATFDAMGLVDMLTEGALASVTSSTTTHSPDQPANQELEEELNKSETEEGDSLSDIDIEDNSYPTDSEHISSSPVKLTRIVPNLVSGPVTASPLKQQTIYQMVQNTGNWPDIHHVIQYASSGSMSFSNPNPTYTLPSQITFPQTISHSPTSSRGLENSLRGVGVASTEIKDQHPKEDVDGRLKGLATKSSRKGCRCGNATAVPGKLTCCGQRCPCYVERRLCIDCRCKGCRNPHQANGKKIFLLPQDPQMIESGSSEGNNGFESSVSASNTVTFQTISEAPQTGYTSVYPLSAVTSYAGFPIPVQVPISIVGLSSILQPNSPFTINKY